MKAVRQTEGREAPIAVPLYGKDEMNFVEFPLSPITPGNQSIMEIDHLVRDPKTKREIARTLVVRATEGLGLPQPVDECVLVGMKSLTHEAGFQSRKVQFSQYHLCRTLGWEPSGLTYRRLDRAFDRLAGTSFKFKDSWWDKGEQDWRSHTFHIIDNVELCSADRYRKARERTGSKQQQLSFFVWNEVVWKSFQDGHIRTLDMEMFRKVSNGRRREVPTRLFRWLAKHFYNKNVVKFDVMKLAVGTLGLHVKYPSEAARVISRAANVLRDVGFIEACIFRDGKYGGREVAFKKKMKQSRVLRRSQPTADAANALDSQEKDEPCWHSSFKDEELEAAEQSVLLNGTDFEKRMIRESIKRGQTIRDSPIRTEFIRRLLLPSGRGDSS